MVAVVFVIVDAERKRGVFDPTSSGLDIETHPDAPLLKNLSKLHNAAGRRQKSGMFVYDARDLTTGGSQGESRRMRELPEDLRPYTAVTPPMKN